MQLIARFPLLLLILIISFQAHGQQKALDTLITKFDHFRKDALQEKIYVHVDRNFFVTGELMWFKLYVVDGSFHKPLMLNKIAYVEILDNSNTSVLNAKVELKNGAGHGALFIPASLSSSTYTLRAYTSWMKNFSPDFFFHKDITIVNTFIKAENDQPAGSHASLSIDILPEGGNLVKGAKSKVGFVIKDPMGRGVDCRGALLSASHDTIVSFKPLKFGIGHFYYTPSDTPVKLVLIDKNKNVSFHKMPEVATEGYVMTVTDSLEYLRVKVQNTVANPSQYLFLFAHTRNRIIQAEGQPAVSKVLYFSVEKKKLGDGISHLTLFDGNLNPICERLYFKLPSNSLTVAVQPDQSQYDTRRKVKINLSINGDQNIDQSDLSVSVYRLDSLSTPETNGILDYLLLTSDIVGAVEDPAYYFSNDAHAIMAMDNLMITQGWRRFDWKTLFAQTNVDNTYVPEYRGHFIHAGVYNANGDPAPGALVYLSSPDKVIRLNARVSDSQGKINFEVLQFWGNRQLIIQPADSTLTVKIENPLSPNYASRKAAPFLIFASVKRPLTERSIGMQVQDIYLEKNRERYLLPKVDSVAFYGIADETYLLDAYTRFPVMEEVMREYVPGVLVRKRRDGFHFLVIDHVNKGVMSTPLILLDGVPVFDADKIMNFDPRKVKKLEVLTRPYHLGKNTFYGIVSYTTYTGDLSGFQLDPKTLMLDYEGLQLQREFYKPQYENVKQRADRTPDHRNLLHWAPQVFVNAEGKGQLEFFTSDTEGTYFVKVEGITPNGIAGSGAATFTVKQFDN